LAAAFTTICSAVIMLFCVISFFKQFAQILFYTILMSTIGSFIVFLSLADTWALPDRHICLTRFGQGVPNRLLNAAKRRSEPTTAAITTLASSHPMKKRMSSRILAMIQTCRKQKNSRGRRPKLLRFIHASSILRISSLSK
jgi:hypothetical protein